VRKTARRQPPFVICIGRQGYPAALEVGKVYRVVPDPAATARGPLRVIDESDEDYLYPDEFFVAIELPQRVVQALSLSA